MAEQKNLVPGRQASLIERLKVTPKIKVGKYDLTFQPDELDEFYKNKARTELREIPEVVDTSLRELREYIRGEPGLVVPDEDEYLIKFLRPCKWYPKSSFELMKRFYKYRLSHPRICEGLLPSKEKAILISGILTPLPLRCNSGERILLLESGRKWKPKEIGLETIFRGVMLALEAAMAEPITQVAGVRVILDMDGLSLSQVTYFTPSFASAVLEWVQKCLPCRLKGVHIVNQPYIFNMVFAIFKPFFQEKLRKRLHFHGSDRASLLSFIDAKALPTQYGGQLELPSEPLGERLWEYFCTYEEDFQGIDFPQIEKERVKNEHIAEVRIRIQYVVRVNLMGLLGSQSGTYFRCWIEVNCPDEVNDTYYSSSMTRDTHFFSRDNTLDKKIYATALIFY